MKGMVLVLVLMLMVPVAQALEDNFFFTIPLGEAPPELRCTNIVLPDDSQNIFPGLEEYTLTTDTDWSSVSYRIITTDENNTVIIPICFARRGEDLCSDPYVISILSTSTSLLTSYRGGVCVSGYSDVDVVSDEVVEEALENNESVMDILNDNVDLFDMGFEIETKTVLPGEPVSFHLLIESYASLTIDLVVVDDPFASTAQIAAAPQSTTIVTNANEPLKEITYTATAAPLEEGTYTFYVVASVRDCELDFCSRGTTATIIVTQNPQDTDSFFVNLFPTSINIRELRPILYSFSIDNQGPTRDFSIFIDLPPELTTTFEPTVLAVGEDEVGRISFTVVPRNVSSFYEFTVTATHEENVKPATAYISTNEMLTDAARAVDVVEQTGNQEQANQANNALNEWFQSYNESQYGQDLHGYAQFRSALQGEENITDGVTPISPVPDYTLFIVIIVVIIIAVVIVAFMRKRELTLRHVSELE
jgi:hypothetical protein